MPSFHMQTRALEASKCLHDHLGLRISPSSRPNRARQRRPLPHISASEPSEVAELHSAVGHRTREGQDHTVRANAKMPVTQAACLLRADGGAGAPSPSTRIKSLPSP